MSSMLVVGSVAFDTLHIAGKSHERVLGGSATYASIAASYFTPVQLVGVVGRDFPDDAVQLLRSKQIDLAGLEVVDGETFHWEGRYADDFTSRETIRTDLNVFADFEPKIPASFNDAPFVMLGNIDPGLQMQVLDQIKKPKMVLVDTMNLWIDIRQDALDDLLKRVDVLVLNDEEARQYTGEHNLVCAGKALQQKGPHTVIIKKGEHGAILFQDDQELFSVPALPLDEVNDPTGAGDTFAGALLGYLAKNDDISHEAMRRAIVYGTVVASYCVQGVSTERVAKMTNDEIDARYAWMNRMVSF